LTLKRGIKMKRREILTYAAISMLLATILAPAFVARSSPADPDNWYMTVSGVLNTDYYTLYPFKTDKSIKFGFSKFGEIIDSRATVNVGLEYRDRDAFAPPAGSSVPSQIEKHKWLSGWLINITYYHIPTGQRRNVWAMAQHADLTSYGEDWIRVDDDWLGGVSGGPLTEAAEDPRDPGRLISNPTSSVRNGGRKTNGTCTTDDIRVLYNSPRRFVARTVTHVKDWIQSGNTDEPLVDVVFTFIFNKDKKEIVVLKDIKIVTTKYVVGPIDVPGRDGYTVSGLLIQFSNRGEWDLGPSPSFDSYVHLYRGTQALTTVYDIDYHLNPTLPASIYSLDGEHPGVGDGYYDMAQIISSDRTYVGWAAFWPCLSDWHVDGGRRNLWWKSLMASDEHAVDATGGPEPFRSPYLIGEWDFILTEERTPVSNLTFDRQFRGVTVYGITDRWNGDDAGRTGGGDVIDYEVLYQLDEVFNPWDLLSAVHKDSQRWVEFHTVTLAEYQAALQGSPLNITLSHSPVKYASIWEQYCSFSERVEWGGARKIPQRSVWTPYHYELFVNETTGVGHIWIPAANVPATGTVIKMLYSTETTYTNYDNIVFTNSTSVNFGNPVTVTVSEPVWGEETFTDYLGVTHTCDIDLLGLTISNSTGLQGGANVTLEGTMDWWAEDIKVFKETPTTIRVYWQTSWEDTATANGITLVFDTFLMTWSIEPPTHTDVHMDWMHLDMDYEITITYNATAGQYEISLSLNVNGVGLRDDQLYDEHIPGRYEWIIVGNHSRAIDSIGAATVAAAFKNKQIEIGNGGLDMSDISWGPNVPYMLADLGYTTWRPSGPAWCDWYDSIGRLALVDDWCTRYPVTSSNMIGVGGPSANLVSEYFNEFTDAIQIYGGMPDILLSDVIFATTCWNTTAGSNYLGQYYYRNGQQYQGNTNTGIGVITTYKDLNGTVGFLIYGWSGDDTYYTCKWFHEYGIYWLQTENPGVTTIIIQIDYNDFSARSTNPIPPNYDYDSHMPYITILERLGTISEKTPHDP